MMVNIEAGETFRQKDGETYHILNLVLYDKAYLKIYLLSGKLLSGQKTGRTACAHDCV